MFSHRLGVGSGSHVLLKEAVTPSVFSFLPRNQVPSIFGPMKFRHFVFEILNFQIHQPSLILLPYLSLLYLQIRINVTGGSAVGRISIHCNVLNESSVLTNVIVQTHYKHSVRLFDLSMLINYLQL